MGLNAFHNFTINLKKVLGHATHAAIDNADNLIRPKYLINGLIKEKGCLGSDVLIKCGVKVDQPNITSKTTKKALPRFSQQTKKIIEKAALVASENNHKYIGTEHLLVSLINSGGSEINEILNKNQVDIKDLNQRAETILKSTSKYSDIADTVSQEANKQAEEDQTQRSKNQALEYFCTDLSDLNIQAKIDPVIGRENEIERLTRILARRTKNNPILIGEAGVGKTAIIEGLAKKINQGEVPKTLINKKIYSLDLGAVIAGTMYRGEFEARFKQIVDEIKNDPDVILFIDEIHTIVGAGSTGMSGGLDAANILKPALAKGEIRCIGATTFDEFKKHIESDTALERRFQPILVEEPTQDESLLILNGIKEKYEQHHNVLITDQAIQAAVKLSTRYLPEKNLPDKAIDLLDEAAAKFKTQQTQSTADQKIDKLIKKLSSLRGKKNQSVAEEDFQKALEIKRECLKIKQQLEDLELKANKLAADQKITEKDIVEIISKITKVPLDELMTVEKEKLLNIEKKLNKHIVGQTEATKAVSDFIRQSRAGLSSRNRPIGSFIFMGPSGVGKTELAKVVAKSLFGDEKSLIRIDMSEFSESFNSSKLIGAPAGYVGYKDSTKLTDQVRRRPYSVVLFDEIEKAHSEIFNLLLQILEDGHLTDATGRIINFKNTVIIMTSNIGLSNLNQGAAMGFEAQTDHEKIKADNKYSEIKNSVLRDLEKTFKPEFINRVNKVIVFKPLDVTSTAQIAKLQLNELRHELEEKDIELTASSSALKLIAKEGFKPSQGARAIRNVISDLITNPLAEQIIRGKFKPGDTVRITTQKGKLAIGK